MGDRAALLLLLFSTLSSNAGCAKGGSPAPSGGGAGTSTAASSVATVSSAVTSAPSAGAGIEDASAAVPPPLLLVDGGGEPAGSGSKTPPEDMLAVPGGTFTMGLESGGEGDERPAHGVTLATFWLDKTEVTNEAWEQCVAAKACREKSRYVAGRFPHFGGPKQPVSGVSWDDAKAYCAFRGKRLPREAEFERAVRGSDGRRFPWGNDKPTPAHAVFSGSVTMPVGSKPAGRGPYGHDDLAGNVWEWMDDEYDPFAYTRATAPEGKPGSCPEILAAQNQLRKEGKQGFTGSNPIPDECEHAIRGGAYNYPADGLRSTNRVHHPGNYRIPMLGVRCAKDPAP